MPEDEMKAWHGIDGNLQTVGAAAINLVVEGLHTHRLGAPKDPKEILIQGKWSKNVSVVGPNVKRSD